MSPRLNLLIQISAVLVFAAFRLAAPGWGLLLLVLSVVGLFVMLLPTILAAATVRRPRLTGLVAVPFLGCAASLVVAGALFPDGDDQRSSTPLLKILGIDGDVNGPLTVIGGVSVLVFLLFTALTPVAVGVTAANPATTPRRSPPAASRPASRVAVSR